MCTYPHGTTLPAPKPFSHIGAPLPPNDFEAHLASLNLPGEGKVIMAFCCYLQYQQGAICPLGFPCSQPWLQSEFHPVSFRRF